MPRCFFFFCNVDYTRSRQYSHFIDQLKSWFKRSLPYISGATIGFTLLLIFMAFGLQSVLTQFPVVLKILAVCGTLFVCYIGIKIILSAANISISSAPVEHMLIPNFKDGFLLQWLNLKAWLACVSGITMFTSIENPQSLPIFIIIYFFTCYACLFFGYYVVINFQWY